ncbi:hypothetical protein GQ53DRAFT_791504 [Thozetella sp. PMI_491]|nr:hypothetical protein GQ53DRAFT_791504 [Thozetella sp. PMI_491]
MPHGQTFEWIYEQPEASRAPWSNFSEWLQTGDSIYWIQGRLGSGKSTLMRYIFENEETRRQLCLWTQGSPIEILAFYFWNSGDENQKSMNGLLRSLLFDLLERYRGLLSIVLPDVWDTWSARATRLPLSSAQLEQWFHDLLTALPSGTKLCFFLDGLDECDEGHSALISFVQKYSLLPGIKFCLSSRPLSVFEQAYTERPGLRLQDLTRGDINHYVQSQLLIHKHMERISESNTDEISRLTEKITLKANGVFLWVKLVVKYLSWRLV